MNLSRIKKHFLLKIVILMKLAMIVCTQTKLEVAIYMWRCNINYDNI